MAIDIKSLSSLISEFRQLQAKDSITPESLGYILQRITDLLASAGTSETVAELRQLLDGLNMAGQAISTFEQGGADRNNILIDSSEVNLSDGSIGTYKNKLFIKQATTERAGAMRSQQVTDRRRVQRNQVEAYNSLDTVAYHQSGTEASTEHSATTRPYNPPSGKIISVATLLAAAVMIWLFLRKR